MRVKCQNCTAGYTLPEPKLKAGRRLQFSCRRCGSRIVVVVPEASEDGEDAAAAPKKAVTSRPSFAPAPRAGRASGAVAASGGKPAGPGKTGPRRDKLLSGGRASPSGGVPSAPTREPTDAIRQREEKRLAGSVSQTRSEKSIRWFVANEDGSYKKWQARDLEVAIRGGLISPETLLWRKGMNGWIAADETPEWRQLYERHEPRANESAPPQPAGPAADAADDRVPELPEERPGGDSQHLSGANEAEPTELSDVVRPGEAGDEDVSVAGAGRVNTGQRSIPMPVVQVDEPEDATPAPRRPNKLRKRAPKKLRNAARKSGFHKAQRSGGTPMDRGEGPDGDKKWAPATDTYTGPRGNYTHRLGGEGERQALLAQVEREHGMQRSLRTWQWISLATAAGALIAFAFASYLLMNWQPNGAECDCTASAATVTADKESP